MSNQFPIETSELYDRLLAAVREMGSEKGIGTLREMQTQSLAWMEKHLEMEHSYPSASMITRCRLQQWLNYLEVEPSEEIPVHWFMRAAAGIINEPYWRALFAMAGFETIHDHTHVCTTNGMIAHPDLVVVGDKERSDLETFIVELKSMSGFGYKKYWDEPGGVYVHERGHYSQMQLYMNKVWEDGLDEPFVKNCLYLVTTPDPGLIQSIMRQRKDRRNTGWNLTPLYLEWTPYNKDAVNNLMAREQMLIDDIDRSLGDIPEREFSGEEFEGRGRKTFPCGYCAHLKTCNSIYNQ